MIIRRWGKGLIAAALLVPTLAACGGDGGKGTTADPKAELLASTEEIGKGNFRFTMRDAEMSSEGVVHAPSKSARLTMTMESDDVSMEMDFIFIESETWVKLDLGELGDLPGMETLGSGKYHHLDKSRAKDLEDFTFDIEDVDPAGVETLIKAIGDVKKTADGTFTGTLDLTKATDATLVDKETVKALGDQAGKVTFEAKLDGQGRLSEFTVEIPAAGEIEAHQLTVTYFDYGSATAPEKPADDEVAEASDAIYEMFGD